jgi:GTP-binding protein
MADGVLLLVDAVEGPMPQTKYVLKKALEMGLKPIVVINKVDRQNARPAQVLELTEHLFLDLATDADQLEFPVLYAVGREGVADTKPEIASATLEPLFEAILRYIPPPVVDASGPVQMLVTTLDYDDYKGKFAIGRLQRGTLHKGDTVALVQRDGTISREKIQLLFTHQGLKRIEVDEAAAGDIVAVTGLANATIGDTIADAENPEGLPPIRIEEPTVKMTFGVNTSPFAGKEGRWSTSRQLRERLFRELEANVALRVEETDSPDEFIVAGRGELHLAILIETIRREGYEFQVSRPEAVTKVVEGKLLEPVEHLTVDTTEEYIGPVTESLAQRQGQMANMHNDGRGEVRLEYTIPTRGLIGFRNEFLTITRGNGLMGSLLLDYELWRGPMGTVRNGALVASETGMAVTYGLLNAQERGTTFIEPGTQVYQGMIAGLYSRQGDLAVNVAKQKAFTNVRSANSEIDERLTPATILSLEQTGEGA